MWADAIRKRGGTVTVMVGKHYLSNYQSQVLTFVLVGGVVEAGAKNSNMAYSRSAIQGARLGGM